MNRTITILSELKTLAPTLANAIIASPYTVPDGYFQQFDATIINKLNKYIVVDDDPSYLKNLSTETPYILPQGYLENLPNLVIQKLHLIEKEEVETENITQQFSKKNPYQVTSDYFENFSNNLMEVINLSNNDEGISNFSKKMPYSVPNNYFENLSNEIIGKTTDLEASIGTLTDLSKTMPFQVPVQYFENFPKLILKRLKSQHNNNVPQGYFDSLSSVLLQKVKSIDAENEIKNVPSQLDMVVERNINEVPIGHFGKLKSTTLVPKGAKKISFKSNISWLKTAIAACFIGSISFTAYQILNHQTRIKEGIAAYTQSKALLANVDVDSELSKLDDTTIAKYLDNETLTENTTTYFQEIKDDNLDEVLQQIPDADLRKHLNESGEMIKQKK